MTQRQTIILLCLVCLCVLFAATEQINRLEAERDTAREDARAAQLAAEQLWQTINRALE